MMNGFEGHGWGMCCWWISGLIIVVTIVWIVVKSMYTNSRGVPVAAGILFPFF